MARSFEAVGLAQVSNFRLQLLLFVCPQTGLFLIGHNGTPQRRQKDCMCSILIETGTQLVGSIDPYGQLVAVF